MKEKFINTIAEKTKKAPAAIHIDSLGLIRLAKDNKGRLEEFYDILLKIERNGGNICIPSYTLSYTKNEIYDILNTASENVGIAAEGVRKKFPEKRTVDALFSYIVLGNEISNKQFEISDYESFGKNSLIEEVFQKDGYICSIGGVFRNCTEIHYIEKLLEVNYRKDKVFEGKLADRENKIHKQRVTYFCKNFDYHMWYDFRNLEIDLKQDGLIETFKTDGFQFVIEGIKFNLLFDYIEKKIRKDYLYLIKDLKDKRNSY